MGTSSALCGSMCRIQTWLLLLGLCAGTLDAWWWSISEDPTTESPTTSVPTTPAATTTTTARVANVTANATKRKEEEDEDLSGVGEEIINVASGIRKFVEEWDATPTARTTNGGLTEKVESANPNLMGNANRLRVEEGEEGGSVMGGGSGDSDGEVTGGNTGIPGDAFETNYTDSSTASGLAPQCLPVPSNWSVCSGKQSKSFTLPNFFNHTSVEEVGAVLQEWAWLARAGCHHSAEWFLCLLLTPRCPSHSGQPLLLPCRSFCQVLQDSCWAALDHGRLPVECGLLPDAEQRPERPACVSVSNWKGNPGGLTCIC